MNTARVLLGGIVGGVAYNVVSMLVNVVALAGRYEILQRQQVYRVDPRLPFLPIYALLLFAVSVGLVWLYAAARPRLGPGPGTAVTIGLVVGLTAGIPSGLAQFSWSYQGGFVSLMHAVEAVGGCVLATLAGAWIYREGA